MSVSSWRFDLGCGNILEKESAGTEMSRFALQTEKLTDFAL